MEIEAILQLLTSIIAIGAATYAVVRFCVTIKNDVDSIKEQCAEIRERVNSDHEQLYRLCVDTARLDEHVSITDDYNKEQMRRHEQSISDAHKKIREIKSGN
jgi:di/tripeptidase